MTISTHNLTGVPIILAVIIIAVATYFIVRLHSAAPKEFTKGS
jgi:hypothetical protein